MDFTELVNEILRGFSNFYWGNAVMIAAGIILMTLAVVKEYEPVLLLPIGFGCILANLGMTTEQGLFKVLYDAGIRTELFPLLIFVGVGAMIDFRPLLAMPHMVLLGAAGQFGIYATLILATLLGLPAQPGGIYRRDRRYRVVRPPFLSRHGWRPSCSRRWLWQPTPT
jgi:carboxybiotin decarboxylase